MPRKAVDISGNKYGRWTVLYRTNTCKPAMWMCRCNCGTQRPVWDADLKRGASQSCGCLSEEMKNTPRTHGLTGSRVYRIWLHMVQRCEDANGDSFQHYGGRGIKICQRWRESAQAFVDDMGLPPTDKHTIDRIDVNGDYEPANCKWATKREQANNTTRTPYYIYHGVRMPLMEAIRSSPCGINPMTVKYRLSKGWDIESAVDTPPDGWGNRSRFAAG